MKFIKSVLSEVKVAFTSDPVVKVLASLLRGLLVGVIVGLVVYLIGTSGYWLFNDLNDQTRYLVFRITVFIAFWSFAIFFVRFLNKAFDEEA